MDYLQKKKVEENLNQYLVNPSSCEPQPLEKDSFGLSFLSCQNNFYGNFQRTLMITKKKIADEVLIFQKNDAEQSSITFLRQCLKSLTDDEEIVLNDGIMTFYSEILEKRDTLSSSQKNFCFFGLLEKILKEMEVLLKYYFVQKKYKENQCETNSQSSARNKKILSQKELNVSQPYQTVTSQIKNNKLCEIWEQMKEDSIQKLFNHHILQEKSVISTTIEMCRICSQKIRLKNLEKHVNFCSKKFQLKGKLNDTIKKQKKLKEDIIQFEKTITIPKKGQKNQKDQHILRIIRIIKESDLNCDSKRRCSMIDKSKKSLLIDHFVQEIQSFQQKYEENELFSSLIQNLKEKQFLQKRLENIQRTASIQNNESQYSSVLSLGSHNIPQPNTFKTKKSLFANDVSISSSSKSSKSLNSQQKKENKFTSLFCERKLSRQTKTKNKNSFTEKEIENSKFYKSLHNFKFEYEEEEQVEKIKQINIKNFEILKFLGKGAFGRVYLARRVDTVDLYALKFIQINNKNNQKDIDLIKNQHEIFKTISGDHLVKAPFSFSSDLGHFFVLQYMPGGDLGKILQQEVYFQEEQAKFYLAQMVLAIQHLHRYKIIHRDLKPENLVLDAEGHIKLTDFGLSQIQIKTKIDWANFNQKKVKEEKTFNKNRRTALVNKHSATKLIGTPDYIAPQIINGISTDNMSIDWWSLGVITYEMLVGCRPFCGNTIDEVLENIKKFNIEWPEVGEEEGMISEEAKDLITKLLDMNFKTRLGAKDSSDIRQHPFFKGIDWENIKRMDPPIKPLPEREILEIMPEDEALRYQIEHSQSTSENQSVRLEKFIRFDILKTETIESAEKKINSKQKTLKKLMSIAQKLTVSHDEYNKSQHRISERFPQQLNDLQTINEI